MNIQTVAADLTSARDFSETGLTGNVTPIPISQIQPEITDPNRRFPAWRLGALTDPRLAHNYPFLASIAIGIIATVIGLELRMVDNGLLPAAGEVLLVTRDSLVTTRLRAACVSRGRGAIGGDVDWRVY